METEKGLTAKEERFIYEYLVDFNGAGAAVRAGYSKTSAKQIAHENLTKPYLKAAIEEKLREANLSAEETLKLASDIARSSLNDYLVVRKVERSKKVKKKLADIIREKREEIDFERDYASRVVMTKKEADSHAKSIAVMERAVVRLEMELERNPKAYRIVYGEPQLVDDIQIDMVKLAKDRELGKIKSLQWSEFGPKVELMSSETMITNLLRVHGLFKDNLELGMKGNIPIDKWLDLNNTDKNGE